jgi:hypothetical protein
MPRPAAKSLVEAIGRDPLGRTEDRLTELLACCVEALPELARWFIDQSGGPRLADGGTATAMTQGGLTGLGRPDMSIHYRAESGASVILYSEQKIDAEFTDAQNRGYPGFRDRGEKLILVAPDEGRYRNAAQFDKHVSWSEVALRLTRLAEAEAVPDTDWRSMAVALRGSAALRFLYEAFVFICESGHVAMTHPLDPTMIQEYGRLATTRETMRDLLDLIRQDPQIQPLAPNTMASEQQRVHWYFTLEANCPLFDALGIDCSFEVCLQPQLDFYAEGGDIPTLSAGFSCYPSDRQLPSLLEDNVVATGLRDIGVQAAMRSANSQCKCIVLRPLSEIADSGKTLRDQAAAAAAWAATKIAAISNLDP